MGGNVGDFTGYVVAPLLFCFCLIGPYCNVFYQFTFLLADNTCQSLEVTNDDVAFHCEFDILDKKNERSHCNCDHCNSDWIFLVPETIIIIIIIIICSLVLHKTKMTTTYKIQINLGICNVRYISHLRYSRHSAISATNRHYKHYSPCQGYCYIFLLTVLNQ